MQSLRGSIQSSPSSFVQCSLGTQREIPQTTWTLPSLTADRPVEFDYLPEAPPPPPCSAGRLAIPTRFWLSEKQLPWVEEGAQCVNYLNKLDARTHRFLLHPHGHTSVSDTGLRYITMVYSFRINRPCLGTPTLQATHFAPNRHRLYPNPYAPRSCDKHTLRDEITPLRNVNRPYKPQSRQARWAQYRALPDHAVRFAAIFSTIRLVAITG